MLAASTQVTVLWMPQIPQWCQKVLKEWRKTETVRSAHHQLLHVRQMLNHSVAQHFSKSSYVFEAQFWPWKTRQNTRSKRRSELYAPDWCSLNMISFSKPKNGFKIRWKMKAIHNKKKPFVSFNGIYWLLRCSQNWIHMINDDKTKPYSAMVMRIIYPILIGVR